MVRQFAWATLPKSPKGPQDTRTLGLFNGTPAVVVLLRRKPNANVIETVDQVHALIPQLQLELPPDIHMQIATDSTNSISCLVTRNRN